MRRFRLWLGLIVIVAIAVGCVLIMVGRRPPDAQVRIVSAALLDLERWHLTNRPGVIASPIAWPASVKALGVDGVEAGLTRASVVWVDDLWGIRWSKRYQLLRQRTNDTTWILSRVCSIDASGFHGLSCKTVVATITNEP